MFVRVQLCSSRLDAFLHLHHSCFLETRFNGSKKSNISGSPLRLTWATHINQVRRRASQRLGLLGPLLNRRSGLSIRNGLTLYKQFICPMINYACPVWRHAPNSHIRRLQVLLSKCLRIIAGTPWYVRNLQLHKDLEVSYLPENIRNLAQSFDSKIPDSENLLVRQLGRYLAYLRDE